MYRCHGRSVDWEGKHRSSMGTVEAAVATHKAVAHKMVARKMVAHPAARIDHKSAGGIFAK
jgi:hypothetical protein